MTTEIAIALGVNTMLNLGIAAGVLWLIKTMRSKSWTKETIHRNPSDNHSVRLNPRITKARTDRFS